MLEKLCCANGKNAKLEIFGRCQFKIIFKYECRAITMLMMMPMVIETMITGLSGGVCG